MTKFSKLKALTCAVALASMSMVNAQEIATWKGFRTSATTFTFDDGLKSQTTYAVPLLDKYGYKASFFAITTWVEKGYSDLLSWTDFKTLVANGHEVGSHSDTHPTTMSDSELSSSKATIESKVGNTVKTVVYPNCNEPTESEIAKYYIGGRICDGQVHGKTPSNYYRISSIICGNQGTVNTASAFTAKMNEAIQKGGWAVFLIHEMKEGSYYSPTDVDAFEGALSYASTNDSKIWVARFCDAIMYAKERDAATVTVTAKDDKSVTLSLTDNLDDNTYNYPLSLRYPLPDGWSDVSVAQNDEELTSSVSDGYIYFDAVPDNGSISIVSGTSAVADPKVAFTTPSAAETICVDSAYTVAWTVEGEANSAYNLKWNAGVGSDIAISSASASSEWTNDDNTFSWSVSNILTYSDEHGKSNRWGAASSDDEWVVLTLAKESTVGAITIDEFTTYGTVTSFEIQYDENGSWKTAYSGLTIGNDFTKTFDTPFTTTKVRFYINSATSGANINYIGLQGVATTLLKSGIKESGSFVWNPASSLKGTGTLTIEKASGTVLATSAQLTINACKAAGGSESGSSACTSGAYTGPSCDVEGTGAYHTGIYRNLFNEYLGKTEEETEAKIQSVWKHFFETESTKVYYETSDGMAYIYDTGNSDVRTEGMSYGMMICVQLDHQEQFDKIWKWAKKYMQYPSGNEKEGLFAWQCSTDGTIKGTSCAPDGEAYFLTALFFASHRWGNDGEINYEEEAQYLIKELLDKPNRAAGSTSPIFNMSNYLITFGETSYGFTDPSYNLPGFLELWARWTDTNQEFWSKTAAAARDLLYNSSNSTTGLFPDYSQFDGTPYRPSWASTYDTQWYKYDAIRCAMNVGMDYHWFASDSRQPEMMKNLLTFFKNDNYAHGYFTVDGSQSEGSYSEGQRGANGVGVFALPESESSLAGEYVKALWNTNPPSGQWRYYNGMVYFLSMLNASGNFKIYKPAPESKTVNLQGEGSVTYKGVTYTKDTTFCVMSDCVQNNVTIKITASTDNADVEADEELTIAPNPASTSFAVMGAKDIRSIEVYSISGVRLINNETSTETSVADLADGTYIVKILSDESVTTAKLIVRRR